MSDLTNANMLCAVGRRQEQYMKDNLPENKVLFLAPTSKESDPQPAKRSVMFSSSPGSTKTPMGRNQVREAVAVEQSPLLMSFKASRSAANDLLRGFFAVKHISDAKLRS